MKHTLFLFAILCVLSGCGPAGVGPGNIRLKRQLTPQELTGVWKLRDDCLTWLAREDGYQAHTGRVHQIDLRPDGSCHFRSVLQNPARYVDCEGTWELLSESNKTSTLDLSLKLERLHGYHLDFTELFGPVEAFEYWGDPDACQILVFYKADQSDGATNGNQGIPSKTNSASSARSEKVPGAGVSATSLK